MFEWKLEHDFKHCVEIFPGGSVNPSMIFFFFFNQFFKVSHKCQIIVY